MEYTLDAYKLALRNTTISVRDAIGITDQTVDELMDGALDAAAKTLAAETEEVA